MKLEEILFKERERLETLASSTRERFMLAAEPAMSYEEVFDERSQEIRQVGRINLERMSAEQYLAYQRASSLLEDYSFRLETFNKITRRNGIKGDSNIYEVEPEKIHVSANQAILDMETQTIKSYVWGFDKEPIRSNADMSGTDYANMYETSLRKNVANHLSGLSQTEAMQAFENACVAIHTVENQKQL